MSGCFVSWIAARQLQCADRCGGPHAVAPGILRRVGESFGAIARLRRHRLEEDRKRRRRRHQPAYLSRLHALWRSGHGIVLTRLRDQTDTRRSVARLRRKLQTYAKGLTRSASRLHRQSRRFGNSATDRAAAQLSAENTSAHRRRIFSSARRRALLSRHIARAGSAQSVSFGADDRRHRGVGTSRLHRARPVLYIFSAYDTQLAATASAICCCST